MRRRRIDFGNYHVGPFCGESAFRRSSWRRNRLFRRTSSGFAIGPMYFWKEEIK